MKHGSKSLRYWERAGMAEGMASTKAKEPEGRNGTEDILQSHKNMERHGGRMRFTRK